jgi:1,4-alpha-glucan branching enzyme
MTAYLSRAQGASTPAPRSIERRIQEFRREAATAATVSAANRQWLEVDSLEPMPAGRSVQQEQRATQTFVYRVPPGTDLRAVRVKGSFDDEGRFSNAWTSRPMRESAPGSGTWIAEVPLILRGDETWEYGFETELSTGRASDWAVNDFAPLTFNPSKSTTSIHSPVTYDLNGATQQGNAIHFRQFFPNTVRDVAVRILAEEGLPELTIPMTQSAEGYYHASAPLTPSELMGRAYVYEFTNRDGSRVQKSDIYAEAVQGPQRGIDRFYIDNTSDNVAHEYWPDTTQFTHFFVEKQFAVGQSQVYLVFRDSETNRQLTRDELISRIGLFSDPEKIRRVRGGQFNDIWSDSVDAQGRIEMTNINDSGNFSSLVNNSPALFGLKYEFQDASGSRLGEANGAHPLTSANDPWDNTISELSGRDTRAALITPRLQPVKRREPTPSSAVYQLHLSSFMTEPENHGIDAATAKDVMAYFRHIAKTGFTDIQILPPVQTQMNKSWRYEGFATQATQSSLGFVLGEGPNARWVTGAEALKLAVEAAHEAGLNVICDVVFNHAFEPARPDLYDRTGDGSNYFVDRDPVTPGTQAFSTPWGDALNFFDPQVAQLIYDYCHYLTNVIGFDGLRFDFTQPIIDGGGGPLLQRVNAMLDAMGVDTRIAENFPYVWNLTQSGSDGLGFTHTLYLALEHALHNNNDGEMSELGKAARGLPLNLDRIMEQLSTDPDISGGFGATVQGHTTHDEVGQGARARIVAMGYGAVDNPRNQRSQDLLKWFHLITAMSPGRAMYFSGDDNGAINPFKWGLPSTWGEGSKWLTEVGPLLDQWNTPALTQERQDQLLEMAGRKTNSKSVVLERGEEELVSHLRQLPTAKREAFMLDVSRVYANRHLASLLALRKSVPELAKGELRAEPLFVHNDDGIMAFRRFSADGDFIVVANAGDHRQGYDGFRLPEGTWRQVHSTDDEAFGGTGFGADQQVVRGGEPIDIPTGGVVFRIVNQS